MPPKSVVCLPSPGEFRVERAVGVVAGEGEDRPDSLMVWPTTTILPSVRIATACAQPRRCRRSRSSACRRRRSSGRASRWGCSGRARSRRRRIADSDDLAVRLDRHPVRPGDRGRRSRWSACRRRRSSGRASRGGCSGRGRSRRGGRCRRRRSCRSPAAPPRSRSRCSRSRSRSSACRRRRSSGRASRRGCSGRAAKSTLAPVASASPTTTILPSAWIATPLAPPQFGVQKPVVCLPSPEKLGSSEPLGL